VNGNEKQENGFVKHFGAEFGAEKTAQVGRDHKHIVLFSCKIRPLESLLG
jgi:hypothetical protein